MLYFLNLIGNPNDFLKMSWSSFSVGRLANVYAVNGDLLSADGLKQTRSFSYIVMLPGLLFELR